MWQKDPPPATGAQTEGNQSQRETPEWGSGHRAGRRQDKWKKMALLFLFLISSDSASIRIEVMFIIATRQCSRVASSTLERRGLEAAAGAGAEGQTF